MKLNDEQQKKLIEKLNEVWQQPKICSVCGHNQWDVSDRIFELREFHGGGMVIGGQSSITPIVHATCKNCSHTLFFNALKIGLIDKDVNSTSKTE
ncbi:hypothetical protein HZB94_05075 [Candidatus Falkowbacteria bacterium]|nr:hypothetical protein [Candidatus Falkowbacteria bacterium]